VLVNLTLHAQKCGENGDDTEHLEIPRHENPYYYSNDPVYPIADDHPVDFIIPDFLKSRTIEAINKLSNDRVYTLEDMLPYGTVPSKKCEYMVTLGRWTRSDIELVFARYFEKFPPKENGCSGN
jgi:hypothetical protein